MQQHVKQPLSAMPGLPARDDAELAELMAVITRIPRGALEEITRNLFRAALGYERSGYADYLTCLAADTLVTIRIRRDPDSDKALDDAPDKPGRPEDTVDLEEVLRERGL